MRTLTFVAPTGSYTFQCSIHPEMVGSFTAQ